MSTVLTQSLSATSGEGESTRVSAPTPSTPTIKTSTLTSTDRLVLSRARLHAAMFPPAPPPRLKAAGLFEGWLDALKTLPGVDLVIETLDAWWSRHPLRPMADVASQTSKVAIRPIAKDHPYALLAVAAVAGMLVAGLRPWRWALRSALFAGLLPQILSKTLSKLPIESWMTMLGGALASKSASRGNMPPSAVQSPAQAVADGHRGSSPSS